MSEVFVDRCAGLWVGSRHESKPKVIVMSDARFIVGDVFDMLATLGDGSVDLVLTSPPFLALRSYLPDGHPDKAKEIGSEPDPSAFIDTLLELTAEWGRVLAPHGSICVELGDTYSGSGGSGGDYNADGLRAGQEQWAGSQARNGKDLAHTVKDKFASSDKRAAWPLAKSACMIPELYRVALAYGINPLTGEQSPAGRWRVRNTVTWCRPNPSPGALGDKWRPATSDLVVACRAKDRWFDLDAVRTPLSLNTHARVAAGVMERPNEMKTSPDGNRDTVAIRDSDPEAGAPPLDYWVIPTHGYKGSHYATFPPKLCEIPIQSMCPRRVCTTCGQPSRRIVEPSAEYADALGTDMFAETGPRDESTGKHGGSSSKRLGAMTAAENVTVGWSDCGHDTWRNGVVLDPFGGSGTTAAVATGHGRDCILIDLDERNADLASERVGMFLTVESHPRNG